jgi:hypothetical protein
MSVPKFWILVLLENANSIFDLLTNTFHNLIVEVNGYLAINWLFWHKCELVFVLVQGMCHRGNFALVDCHLQLANARLAGVHNKVDGLFRRPVRDCANQYFW